MNTYMRSLTAILILIAAVIFFAIDLTEQFSVQDYPLEWHHVFEWVVFAGVVYLSLRELARHDQLRKTIEAQAAQIDQVSGQLSAHVDATFANWHLTKAESDVAWLLIKGFAFAEIAELRQVREKSVRQQAASIYRKAGIKGRAELVAYFLEDLIARQPKDNVA